MNSTCIAGGSIAETYNICGDEEDCYGEDDDEPLYCCSSSEMKMNGVDVINPTKTCSSIGLLAVGLDVQMNTLHPNSTHRTKVSCTKDDNPQLYEAAFGAASTLAYTLAALFSIVALFF